MFARQALYPLNYPPASERALFKLDYLCKGPSLLDCLSLESGNVVPKKPSPPAVWIVGHRRMLYREEGTHPRDS